MTALDIEKAIAHRYKRAIYTVDRIYLFDHKNESDFVIITDRTEYAFEFEIKLSREDFKVDFEKNKHSCFKDVIKEGPDCNLPNKFFFVCPEGLIKAEEVPDYAGLIHVTEFGTPYTIKNAPFLHKSAFNLHKRLLKKVYWKKNNWKDVIEDQKRKIKMLEYVREGLELSISGKGYDVYWGDKEKLVFFKLSD